MRLFFLPLLLVPLVAQAQTPPPADTLAARWTQAIETDDLAAANALLVWGDGAELPIDPPLYLAARAGRTSIVRALLATGAPVETTSRISSGTTPLHAALYFGHSDAVSVLIDAGADVRRRNDVGYAAFDWALEGGNRDGMGAVLARYERTHRPTLLGALPSPARPSLATNQPSAPCSPAASIPALRTKLVIPR